MDRETSDAIVVRNVAKAFKLPHERHTSFKSLLINFYRRKRSFEKQAALRDISFSVKKGEFFGIVGRNGGGKSTLLKLLAGIYSPDKGSIQINGNLTPFIELGVGFNHELSGRENVFLNGALLGFSHKEMEDMYDDIVAFAELERFMDQKLKNYSSGMQVRLAFSIAIRARTDILILDEVLAVGDAAFQQKCFEVFSELRKRNVTMVLVTHDMNAVLRFCDRAMLISEGKVSKLGKPSEVAEAYLALNYEQNDQKPEPEDDLARAKPGQPRITKVTAQGDAGRTANTFEPGQTCTVDIAYKNPSDKPIHFGLQIYSSEGDVYCFGTNTKIGGLGAVSQQEGTMTLHVDLGLVPGNYYFTVATLNEDATALINYVSKAVEFRIKKKTQQEGVALLKHNWKGSK